MTGLRALFVSDVHLGAPECRAERLLRFLDGVEADSVYLVGDIVDSWFLSRPWPAAHSAVVRRLFEMSAAGARVVYIPGNHDAFARGYSGGPLIGDVSVEDRATYVASDGRRYLVVHGDKFDRLRWISPVRDFPISRRLKSWFHQAAARIDGVEAGAARAAAFAGLDGVICGHAHIPADRTVAGVRYLNCGDWVGSCTAVIDRQDGGLAVVADTDNFIGDTA